VGVREGDDRFEFVADRLDPLPLLPLLLLTPFFVDVELDPFVFTCSSLIASPLDDFEPVGLVLAMTNRDDVDDEEIVPLEDDADIVAVDDAELLSVSLGFDDEDDEEVLLLELPVEFELLAWTLF
jgi:hypothetical protein